MNTVKEFLKSKTGSTVIAVLAVLVLAAVLLFALKSCGTEDVPVQGDVTEPSTGDSVVILEPEQTVESDPDAVTYTVTFVDYDGKVLKTEVVEEGKAATAPTEPKRKNFTFAGWDKSFDNVTADLTVTATYTTEKTVIYAESVTVDKAAKEVTVDIRVINNPGIQGAVLKLSVDDKAFALKASGKTGYPGLNLTAPGSGVKGSPYTFMLDGGELSGADKADGTLFSVTFKIKNGADAGEYTLGLSCDKGAIFDEKLNDLKVVFENGTITVK